jgi:DMSO/TMAO reductase YedYZ molybdopterin-dependent catalytic subunit
MGLFSKEYPPEVAARVPPGNRLVTTWPVLHYGPIPTFDGTEWDLEVSGKACRSARSRRGPSRWRRRSG